MRCTPAWSDPLGFEGSRSSIAAPPKDSVVNEGGATLLLCCERCSLLGRRLAAYKLVGRRRRTLNLKAIGTAGELIGAVGVVHLPEGERISGELKR